MSIFSLFIQLSHCLFLYMNNLVIKIGLYFFNYYSDIIFSINYYLFPVLLLLSFFLFFSLYFINKVSTLKYFINISLLLYYILTLKLFNELFYFTNFLDYKYVLEFNWLYFYNISFKLGLDSISIFFIFLTSFLILICIFSLIVFFENSFNIKELLFLLLLIKFLLILTFSSLNLLLFFSFYEALLFPMFLLVGVWGSRKRRIRASYFLLMYTIFGSVFMLTSILYIYIKFGSLDLQFLYNITDKFSIKEQILLFLGFFTAFAVKIPMIPVHIWLPEAHVEAPTVGSIILAGLLLKLGGYGMIKFCLFLFADALYFLNPYISCLSILGIIYTSLTTLRQNDLKKIIAYSSIGHMNMVVLGIFSLNILGLSGAIFLMISHGFISSCLFFLIGSLYDRYKTRNIKEYSGLVFVMPTFVIFLFLFILGNMSFPGTSAFIAEFLIMNGIFQSNFINICGVMIGVFLTTVYSIWFFNRLAFGNLKVVYGTDLSKIELYIVTSFLFYMILFGFYPNILLSSFMDFMFN
jgi:proton-translocating NADH-quinone oxidoreductase chain M